MSLQDLVTVTITASTVSPTKPGFGTPLIASFHTRWTDLARKYSSLSAMVSDGFATTDPAYRAAQSLMAQNPSVASFYIGRRALAPQQVVNLTLASTSNQDTYSYSIEGFDGVVSAISEASTGTPNTDATSMAALFTAPAVVAGSSNTGTLACTAAVAATGVSGKLAIQITTAGAVGTAKFSWQLGSQSATGVTTAASNVLGTTGVTLDFGSGSATTVDTYSAAIVTNVGTVSHSSAVVTFTQDSSHGHLIDIVNWDVTNKHIIQLSDTTADPGIATDLTNILNATPPGSWYGLGLDSNSSAEVQAAAAWAESNGAHIFFSNNSDYADWQSSSTTDVIAELKSHAYTRTFCLFDNTQLLSWSGCAAMGAMLPQTPGSMTLAYKTLAGVAADNLTETMQANLQAKNGNYYVTIAGIDVISGQFGGGISGAKEFMDIVWGIDWLQSSIQIDVFALLAGSLKVPYTDTGAQMIAAVVQKDLTVATTPQYNFLATNPAPSVSVPKVATIDIPDVAARNLPNVTFQGTLAGAIHTLQIAGTLVLP